MRKFELEVEELAEILQKSTVVEIDQQKNAFGEATYYVRKKGLELDVNDELSKFMGFNIETIKQLSKD